MKCPRCGAEMEGILYTQVKKGKETRKIAYWCLACGKRLSVKEEVVKV